MAFDAEAYRQLLEEQLELAEQAVIHNLALGISTPIESDYAVIFSSQTQAYREVLLGCVITRILDPSKDIHLPYVRIGNSAFNGRMLDEKVINPFLRENKIPCSRGPYLSVFRRQVRFDETTREGLRDQRGYDAFLRLLTFVAGVGDDETVLRILRYHLYQFVRLREDSKISLIQLERVSLNQYKKLIDGLLNRQSGGVFPVILVTSILQAIINRFNLDWQIDFQGINVADRAAGVGGDIRILEEGTEIMTIEVTERPVEISRLAATFSEKIVPMKLSDYVFVVNINQISEQTKLQAEKYFAQGYEINFVDIREWLDNTLVLIGPKGRQMFQNNIVNQLMDKSVSKTLRVLYNIEISKVIG